MTFANRWGKGGAQKFTLQIKRQIFFHFFFIALILSKTNQITIQMQEFGEKIELLIAARGWQKGAFAEKIGVRSSTLSRIFGGQTPKPVTIKKIADALAENPEHETAKAIAQDELNIVTSKKT